MGRQTYKMSRKRIGAVPLLSNAVLLVNRFDFRRLLVREAEFFLHRFSPRLGVQGGTATRTFHTCPPKRVLLIGDSLAYTLGVGMMQDEQRYGVEIANAASLGCAFTTSGELNISGTWQSLPAGCSTALQDWARDAQALRVQAVLVSPIAPNALANRAATVSGGRGVCHAVHQQ